MQYNASMAPQTERKENPALAAATPRRWAGWVVVALLGVAGLVLTVLPQQAGRAPGGEGAEGAARPERPPDADIEEAVARNPGYLGAQACAPCHADRLAQMQDTNHFRACRVARPGDMPRSFDAGPAQHASHLPDVRFEMTRRGDEFVQTTFREAAADKKTSTRIDFAYGAGPADEI